MRSEAQLGEAIKTAREATGMSQERLARTLDVSVSTISRLERGVTRSLTVRKLWALCRALNVTPDELVDWNGR